MRYATVGWCISLTALFHFGTIALAQETYSYVDLVDQMIDLEHEAVLPDTR